MNKADLVEFVMKDTDSTRAEAERAVKAVLAGIQRGVKRDKSCQLVGFGTFTLKTRKARQGRNPQTGEAIRIKASRTVGFKPSAAFKKTL